MERRLRASITSLILLGVTWAAPTVGNAQILPPLPLTSAVWSGSVSVSQCIPPFCTQALLPVTGPGQTGGIESSVIGTQLPGPSILASAQVVPLAPPVTFRGASAYGQFIYSFAVGCNGTLGNCAVTVPVFGQGLGWVSSFGPDASSEAKLTVAGIPILDVDSANGVATGIGSGLNLDMSLGSFTYLDKLFLTAGSTNLVVMEAEANATTTSGLQSAGAFIDPIFFIDPSFPDADQYEIFMSPDVGNALAVPEPATLALVGLGLAGLGFSRRKQ